MASFLKRNGGVDFFPGSVVRIGASVRKLRTGSGGGVLAASLLFALSSALLISLTRTTSLAQTKPESASSGSVEQGKYIVDHVAMCVECHTPRDDAGNLLESHYLEGAPIPVKPPPYPSINWALKAPAIAGLIGYTKEEGVRLLMEGFTRDGRIPNPPMPRFRLNRGDAEAVVDYLKSLR